MTVDSSGQQPEELGVLGFSPEEALRPGTERPVIFFLPGLGGEEDPELEKFWAPSRDYVNLVPIAYLDWTELVEADCDFAKLAAHVKRQIISNLPEGPVRMAGYSIGGHLAYAMAMDLQAEGRAVRSIAIMDAPANFGDFSPSFAARLKSRIEGLMEFDIRSGMASVLAKILVMDRSRSWLRRLARYRSVRLPFRFERFLHHKITMQLVRRIFPSWWQERSKLSARLDSPTFLFRSEEHEPLERQDLGWGEYCKDLQVIPVAGSHRGMLDPIHNGPLRAAFLRAMSIVKL